MADIDLIEYHPQQQQQPLGYSCVVVVVGCFTGCSDGFLGDVGSEAGCSCWTDTLRYYPFWYIYSLMIPLTGVVYFNVCVIFDVSLTGLPFFYKLNYTLRSVILLS